VNDINSVLIEGDLVRDPEVRASGDGTPMTTFTVASRFSFMQGHERLTNVSFFDVEVSGKDGETRAKVLEKGRGVRVVGRLEQRRWADPATDLNHAKVIIIGTTVELMSRYDRKPEGSES
jgi:single-strand DNA-binding protein